MRYSVVIPVFNQLKFPLRAIGSVLAQFGEHDFEIVVVNDGGERFELNWSKVRVIDLPENRGLSAARNTGIQKSFGEWICCLDSDDWFQPEYLNLLSREQQLFPDRVWAYTSFYEWKEGSVGKLHEAEYDRGKNLASDLYHRDFIGMSTLSFRKSAWEKIGGFDESLRCNEDWQFKLQLAESYAPFVIETPIVNIVTHDGGLYLQSVKNGLAKKTERIIKERFKHLV